MYSTIIIWPLTKVYINFNSTNIAEPFEWTKKVQKNAETVYYKSQNLYTYPEANGYCRQQGGL